MIALFIEIVRQVESFLATLADQLFRSKKVERMKLCGFDVGLDKPLFVIAVPCVVESKELVMNTAERITAICAGLQIPFIFKSSFDKASRTSHSAFRGPGFEKGLRILENVRREFGVSVLTDVHEDTPLDEVPATVDILQTPAFLVRQTNFIQGVARTGKPVNIGKGQFLVPWDMKNVVEKCREVGNDNIMVCERGVRPVNESVDFRKKGFYSSILWESSYDGYRGGLFKGKIISMSTVYYGAACQTDFACPTSCGAFTG